jgi:hypothetical protein
LDIGILTYAFGLVCDVPMQQGSYLNLNFKFQYCLRKLLRILVVTIQVYDEPVEVDPSLINKAALLLQMSMENAAALLGMCSILPLS